MNLESEREQFTHWVSVEKPFDENVGRVENAIQEHAAWLGWIARSGVHDYQCNEAVQRDMKSLAMMLRMCAYRLRTNGHADLGDKAVDLLRRTGMIGSPLRDE